MSILIPRSNWQIEVLQIPMTFYDADAAFRCRRVPDITSQPLIFQHEGEQMRNTSRFRNPFLGEDNKAKPKNFAYAGVSVLRMLVQRHGLAWQSYGRSDARGMMKAEARNPRSERNPKRS